MSVHWSAVQAAERARVAWRREVTFLACCVLAGTLGAGLALLVLL